MKYFAIAGLILGIGLALLLVLSHGVGGIWHSAALLGLGGFAVICLYHLALIGLMGIAWWLLARGRADARPARFAWGRLIRESAAETLPLSQLGGYVLGVRAMTLAGVSGSLAAGSTVVDVTAELMAQLGYTLLGLVLLTLLRPGTGFALPVLGGVCVMGGLAAVFLLVQARGAGLLERASARLAQQFLGHEMAGTGAVQAVIAQIHGRPGAMLGASLLHFGCWVLSGTETWMTLWLMGVPLSLPEVLAIDSLLYGLRSAAFLVPNALGVQEGGFVLLGGLFGLDADTALALSLIKRARDLAIGIPALLIWQVLEGRRAWVGGRPAAPSETPG